MSKVTFDDEVEMSEGDSDEDVDDQVSHFLKKLNWTKLFTVDWGGGFNGILKTYVKKGLNTLNIWFNCFFST